MTSRPIGVSLGDPAGIGPEIVVRALAERPSTPVRIFGDASVLERAAHLAGVAPPPRDAVARVTELGPDQVVPGRPSHVSAKAQLAYLEAATGAALAGEIAALVTAPISKEWIARAGFTFPGHTEYLASACGTPEFAMMLAGPSLRVTLATIHIALREVPGQLTAARIASAATLTARTLARDFGLPRPRVAVAALNPHAGEAGQFGDEEERLIRPALAAASARILAEGLDVELTGPHVPDAVFRQAALGGFDAVVAMYHDQGLIPLKLLHFDDGVNLTLGLPFVRTSPDHGTAYDIAGTGRASPRSFLAALDMALALSRRRTGVLQPVPPS